MKCLLYLTIKICALCIQMDIYIYTYYRSPNGYLNSYYNRALGASLARRNDAIFYVKEERQP